MPPTPTEQCAPLPQPGAPTSNLALPPVLKSEDRRRRQRRRQFTHDKAIAIPATRMQMLGYRFIAATAI